MTYDGSFLLHLQKLEAYRKQIVHIEHIPATEPEYGKLEEPLPEPIEACLEKLKLTPLFSHQTAALNHIRKGKNVIVTTPAASGKSLVYHLPVLEAFLLERGSRFLYVYPTKALAQDQMAGLARLGASMPSRLRVGTYDGDTPNEDRADIRRRADVVLTNPDMLHLGILPNHRAWAAFLRRLRYVVIDEAHTYRGVFGSHVANVVRRLRRVCDLYGASPQFILCSATIANPDEHSGKLVGLPFEMVTRSGAPRSEKDFVFWDPPLVDEQSANRRSANSEATLLLTELVKRNIRTIVFARTRKLTELIYMYARDSLAKAQLGNKIKPYRAGYLAEDRRAIEKELFSGKLTGVVATTALELGIDIGDLEASVLTGYPGSISSTWQQAGRSGRRAGKSLSVLIGVNNPLDQYLMRNPDFFFQRSYEAAMTNPSNYHILEPHLLCAAWEQPLSASDRKYFEEDFEELAQGLQARGLLRRVGNLLHIAPSIRYPAENINLRSASADSFSIVDTSAGNRVLETIESSRAFFQVHPGAIYLHQGEAYLINELDVPGRVAYAAPAGVPYYTQTRELTDIRIVKTMQQRWIKDVKVCLGTLNVREQVVGFRKKMQFTEEVLGEEVLDLPARDFETVGLWFNVPERILQQIRATGEPAVPHPHLTSPVEGEGINGASLPRGRDQERGGEVSHPHLHPLPQGRGDKSPLDVAGGLHAAEHAAIGLLPLFALCDRNDIGGLSTEDHPDTGEADIFIYDGFPGGIGIAERGYFVVQELWEATARAIAECPCAEGCPACVQSPKCGNNNDPLDKKAALVILQGLIAGR